LESIVKDIIYLKSIPVDMAGIGSGIGYFIYHTDTPIENKKSSFLNCRLKL
jgi:hypothetical protein